MSSVLRLLRQRARIYRPGRREIGPGRYALEYPSGATYSDVPVASRTASATEAAVGFPGAVTESVIYTLPDQDLARNDRVEDGDSVKFVLGELHPQVKGRYRKWACSATEQGT